MSIFAIALISYIVCRLFYWLVGKKPKSQTKTEETKFNENQVVKTFITAGFFTLILGYGQSQRLNNDNLMLISFFLGITLMLTGLIYDKVVVKKRSKKTSE